MSNSVTQEAVYFENDCNCGYCPPKFEGVSAHMIRYAFLRSSVTAHQCEKILELVPELERYVPLVRTRTVEANFGVLRPSYDYADQGVAYISPATNRNDSTARDVAWFRSLGEERKKKVLNARKNFLLAQERLHPNPPK